MFSWVSALGLISNVVGFADRYLNKKLDVDLEKFKVNGQVDMNLVNAHAKVLEASQHHQRNKWMQWAFVFPTACFYSAIVIDCIGQRIFGWKYDVLALPDQVQYVPIAIIGFLFFYSTFRRP